MNRPLAALVLGACLAGSISALRAEEPMKPPAQPPGTTADVAAQPPGTRNGREIYQRFREGLADKQCGADASARWRKHFAAAPKRLASHNDDVLPLFGYVVDAMREAHLPTEYALIPFVESGYKPGARSSQGPAGLWQMIALTARNHKVPIRPGYDGRLSPIDSTQAAVRYLKTLHGMFAGDWRLAVMAYNAGEYRILGALKRGGQTARNARPEALPGLSDITYAYVRKLHALSCLMEDADDREEWLRALDRPVPRLEAISIPDDVATIDSWARRNGQDAKQLARLNPAFADGSIKRAGIKAPRLLAVETMAGAVDRSAVDAPSAHAATTAIASPSSGELTAESQTKLATEPEPSSGADNATASPRHHVVARGDNASAIARRYGIRVADLLERNGLTARAVLKPGKVLQIDSPLAATGSSAGSSP